MESPKYELIIEAKDMAGLDVGLTGTATATIIVDDKNDHAPEFTKKEVNIYSKRQHDQVVSDMILKSITWVFFKEGEVWINA